MRSLTGNVRRATQDMDIDKIITLNGPYIDWKLVADTLAMALKKRNYPNGVISHSDQGGTIVEHINGKSRLIDEYTLSPNLKYGEGYIWSVFC